MVRCCNDDFALIHFSTGMHRKHAVHHAIRLVFVVAKVNANRRAPGLLNLFQQGDNGAA